MNEVDDVGVPESEEVLPSLLEQKEDGFQNLQPAIWIRDVYKQYGWGRKKVNVLMDLDMTIPKGVIYGLLGPSGCGKTTLLQCTIGRQRIQSGELLVFGHKPGSSGSGVPGRRVGYMPQELALYKEFTILETLEYFGRIFHMSPGSIKMRAEFLLDFLDLPRKNRLIQNLSGGQQRRASLAIALLHEPELLILDEPTVGVDPVLRHSIWEHLLAISNNPSKKTTIVITTHYVEEARRAHIVGMMRYGRLLAESPPANLMKLYNKPTLELVFFNLCRKESSDDSLFAEHSTPRTPKHNPDVISLKQIQTSSEAVAPSFSEQKSCLPRMDSIFALHRLISLVIKNFIRMWRNIGFLIFQFILPTLQVSLFCLAIGGDLKGMSLAVANEDIGSKTCTGFAEGCSISENPLDYLSFSDPVIHPAFNLSCRYLSFMDKDAVDLVYYDDYASAKQAVELGKHWGMLHFTPRFSKAFPDRVIKLISMEVPSNQTLFDSQVHAHLDMTNQQVGHTLKMIMTLSFQSFVEDILQSCNKSQKILGFPLHFHEPIYGAMEPKFTEFMAPGVILSITYFMAVGLTAQSFILERKEGLLERSWVAGVTATEVMLAHIIAQFAVMVVQVGFVLLFMIYVFSIPSQGPLFLIILLTILQGICGMSFGLVISSMCNTEQDAIQVALGSFYPILLLSGIIWPLEGMPRELKYVSYALPQTLACEAMRGVLSRGWNLEWTQVSQGFLVTIAWICVFQIVSAIILRIRR
ncbi:ABC transporter G family member 20 [Lepeophtheirus salmonis]|nr:ABC transporter G family member 20-like [Lepeophtheirus salmonis]XP_040579310.1 ABC transporter G family member 20-like [Lepeophtheirus salmonis]XP_040579312.1 ABC transporter G family member 20-like [Lepeophtheirus salmonis]XP_040579313.1 ABC transporter G family member 20-like [Lepeophtheirus salmonis]